MFWGLYKSEVEFLREQVKDLQAQVIVLSGKQIEYINTRIVQESPPLNGKKIEIKEPTEEELKRKATLERDMSYMLGGI